MSSGFVSGGTIENPIDRDEEWRVAQAEVEAQRRAKEEADKQNDGKSLYEVLQANKAAKQEAFEEATRLKNQYRPLDDDEAEFLDSVLAATRRKEAEVKKETLEQLDVFRRRQEEAERKAHEEDVVPESTNEEAVHWVSHGKKRKKGVELLKGVKLRRSSSAKDDKAEVEKDTDMKLEKCADASPKPNAVPAAAFIAKTSSPKPAPAAAPVSNPMSLSLGYASSDEDD